MCILSSTCVFQVLTLSKVCVMRSLQSAVWYCNARWAGMFFFLNYSSLNCFLSVFLLKPPPAAAAPQVGNMKKETSAQWSKDGHEIKADEHLGFTEGVLKLEIAQVRRRKVQRDLFIHVYIYYMCIIIRFPRRMLVCMRLFWRMREEKTRPRWI